MREKFCRHVKPDGIPCLCHPQRGSEWCWFHDPAKEKHRRRASSEGGRNKASDRMIIGKRKLNSLEDAISLVDEVMEKCLCSSCGRTAELLRRIREALASLRD